MNNGIVAQRQTPPAMPNRLLGRPTPVAMPRGVAQRFEYDPHNFTLVFDTSLEPANLQVTVPTGTSGGTFGVTIDWGDGSSEFHTTPGLKTHTYASPGIYVVQVDGRMNVLGFSGASTENNKRKLVRCLSFGDIGLNFTTNGFLNCVNLIEVPKSLPTSLISLGTAFVNCTQLNDPNMVMWDTANITSMASAFQGCAAFNQPIGRWNTSRVTNMASMFNSALSFNQPIGNWDTSRVTNFASMFSSATSFNQPIGGWDTSSATAINQMFFGATAFQQTLGGWNVSNVNAAAQMFQSGRYAQDASAWDIRKVTSLALTFNNFWGTSNYDAALIAWAALPDADLRTQAIGTFAASGSNTRVTSASHGMVVGSRVNISGTTNYNGDYNVIAVAANTFDIAIPFVANDATGTMRHRRSRNVDLNVGALQYSSAAAAARAQLINDYGWIITDGGQA